MRSNHSGHVVAGLVLIAGFAGHAIAQPACRTWSNLGGAPNQEVLALCSLDDGRVVAGGRFTSIGGTATGLIALWDGSQWSQIGEGLFGSRVTAIARTSNGLVVTGSFRIGTSTILHSVASWDGVQWTPLSVSSPSLPPSAPGPYASVYPSSIAVLSDGLIAVAGKSFSNNELVCLWNGTQWTTIGVAVISNSPLASTPCLSVLPTGDLLHGGDFSSISGVAAHNIARWNGTTWSAMGEGLDDTVNAVFTPRSGYPVAGGTWTTAPDAQAAQWDGESWEPMPLSGLISNTDEIRAFAQHPTGPLVVAGNISFPNNILISNGPTWVPLGPRPSGTVKTLAILPNGDVIAGGNFMQVGDVPLPYLALRTTCLCPADRDNGSGTGFRDDAVDINDLLYFLTRFEEGTWEADLDNDGELSLGSPDSAVTIEDLLYFLGRFEMGC